MNTATSNLPLSIINIITDRFARLMPAPAEFERFLVKWQPARMAPPPETKEPDGEPEEPEPQYPFWMCFIENPRPQS